MGLQRMEPNAHGYRWCRVSSSSPDRTELCRWETHGRGFCAQADTSPPCVEVQDALSRLHSDFFFVPGQPGFGAAQHELDLSFCVAGGREIAEEQLLKGKML